MQNLFDTLDDKVSIIKKMAKYEIDSIKPVLRSHYNSNSKF